METMEMYPQCSIKGFIISNKRGEHIWEGF